MSGKSIRQKYKTHRVIISQQGPIKMIFSIPYGVTHSFCCSPGGRRTKGEVFHFVSLSPLMPNLLSFSALWLTVQRRPKGHTSMWEQGSTCSPTPIYLCFLSSLLFAHRSRSWPQEGPICSRQGSKRSYSVLFAFVLLINLKYECFTGWIMMQS